MDNIIHLSLPWPRRLAALVHRFVGRGIDHCSTRVGRLPPWCWPLLVALAAWPSGSWAARRLLDDSDDPLGIVALVASMMMLWHARTRFARTPRLACLAVATGLVAMANLPFGIVPDLLRALLASGAVVVALAAVAERSEPIAPYAGLAILSLPLLSSLQFYAGFPLRVVTAEASRWLLTACGSTVERMGSALTVDGRLVLVDAPCSGVRMAWVGYFTACVVAWLFRLSNRAFVARLPMVGMTVLLGNIARNTVLVAAEADGVAMTDAMHAAVGLVAFAIVSGVVAAVFARARPPRLRQPVRRTVPRDANAGASTLLVTVSLLVAAALPLATSVAASTATPMSSSDGPPPSEWPTSWDDEPMRPLALSPVELRFASRFPGTIGRFAAASRTIVLRDVLQPTRRLHPAVDCYRGLGHTIAAEHLERDDDARLWRCFVATPRVGASRGLRVCERIVDVDGRSFTDVSSWYWAASLSRSKGPWRAVTIATPIAGTAS